jgi:HSP20 family protein
MMFYLMPRRREGKVGLALARTEKSPFEILRREFASLFDRAFAGWPVPFEPAWELMEPAGFEMEEKEAEVIVRAEMPGFEASELDVQLTGDLLTIRAEHREEPEKGEKKPVERRYGKLERTVTLPPGIEPEKVEARYHNGVLEVHIPRSPAAMPKRIEVKV